MRVVLPKADAEPEQDDVQLLQKEVAAAYVQLEFVEKDMRKLAGERAEINKRLRAAQSKLVTAKIKADKEDRKKSTQD
jgi:hypothetical protein